MLPRLRNLTIEQKRIKMEKRQSKLLTETILRAPILRSCHTRATLMREGGMQPGYDLRRASAGTMAAGLQQRIFAQEHSCGFCGMDRGYWDFEMSQLYNGAVCLIANSARGPSIDFQRIVGGKLDAASP